MEGGTRRSRRRANSEASSRSQKRSFSERSESEKAASNSAKADEQSPTGTERVSAGEAPSLEENGAEAHTPTESADGDFVDGSPTRKKKKMDHQNLIDTIRTGGKLIQQAVKHWVERYESDSKAALSEILTMLFEACGVKYQFQEVSVDEIDVDDVVVDLVNLARNGELEDYYGAKHKAFKQFKENLLCFWDGLVLECQNGPLFDQVLFEKCMDYDIALSCTPPRVFRHVATLIGLQLVTSFITVANTLARQRETTQRQLNTEKKKRKEGPRLESLNKRLSATHEKITVMEEMMRKIFTGLFMHRYRDIDPDIRMTCIESLGVWVVSYPSLFLQDLYLKYLGWMLNDKSAGVRKTSIIALQNLYAVDDNVPSLSLFTERFSKRMVELADDIDISVAVSAIGLIKHLLRHQLLAEDELGPLYDLLIDENPAIRHAVGELIYDHLIAQKFNSSLSSSKETESSEVHIGRLLQILREFSTDPILSTYVIDDIWDHMDALKDFGMVFQDWKCIISMLLDDNSLTELTDVDGTSLVRLLCTSIKKSVGEKIVPSNDNRKHAHTKAQKETMENNKHEITVAMIKKYPQILRKFIADKAKVSSLVEVIVHMKLELYSLKRQEQNFQAVLQLVKDAFFKHGENETLASCIKAITFCATESQADLQDFARNRFKDLEDELFSKLKSAIRKIRDGDDEYDLLVNLRRLHNFQLSKGISNDDFYEDFVGILRDFKNLDNEVVGLLLLNMFMNVLWCRLHVDEENPSEASVSSLVSKRSILFGQLDYFMNTLLMTDNEGKGVTLLTSRVCIMFSELWILFNEAILKSSRHHLLGFRPEESTVQQFWKLCEKRLNMPDDLDDEDADEEPIDEMNKQDVIVIAAAKLVLNGVVPKDSLGPEIISRFVMHGPSVAEIVKNFIVVLKKTATDDLHKLLLEALKRAYQRHQIELSAVDEDYSTMRSFLECKDLAAKLAATFVGAARLKHRMYVLEIVKNGITYAFEDQPKRLSFLEGAVLQFVPKLPASDVLEILKETQKRVEDVNTDEDPSGWRPYHSFVDNLREKYVKNQDFQGEEGRAQRGLGRRRKANIRGKKLFEDQNSSEEEDDGESISDSDQDEPDEEYERPLRDSLRSLKLRSLKLGRNSQEKSNDIRSISKQVDSGKATLDNVLSS